MITFAVCSTETGQILRTGGTNSPQVEDQAGDGEFVVVTDGTIRDDTHYWDEGWRLYPEMPSRHHRWDHAEKAWIDPRTPDEIKNEAKDALKRRRDVALSAGTRVGEVELLTDEVTQGRITGAALAALIDPAYQVQWKMPDGSFIVLTAPQIIAFAQAIRSHVQACFNREAELIALIEAGQPYDLEAGWP